MKNQALTFAVILGLSPSIYASNFLQKMRVNLPESTVNSSMPTITKNYTDFSGTWVGTCNTNGNVSNDETLVVNIRDPQEQIIIDGLDFTIGGLTHIGEQNLSGVEEATVTLNWANEQKELVLNSVYYNKKYRSSAGLFAIVGKETLSMANNQLLLKATFSVSLNGEVSNKKYLSTCTYNKQG